MRSTIEFDFPGIQIGSAEDATGPTGCTVIRFNSPASAAMEARGGSVAARESELLSNLSPWNSIDAIVFAGGSTYGLEAASGVMKEFLSLRDGKTDFVSIPSVPAAVVYDFSGRENSVYPTRELGVKAFRNSRSNQLDIGKVGAGVNTSVGKIHGREFSESGYLCAGFSKSNKHRIFTLSVVNSMGNIVGYDGEIIAGSWDRNHKKRVSSDNPNGDRGNTTLTACVTDANLSRAQLNDVAKKVNQALEQIIRPYATPYDGDVVYVATTSKDEHSMNSKDAEVLSREISEVATRAILDTFLKFRINN